MDLETITDPVEKCSLEAQIQEFGQTPKVLFAGAHPSRNDIGKAVDIATLDLVPPLQKIDEPANRSNVLSSSTGRTDKCSRDDSEADQFDESEEAENAMTANRRSVFAFRSRSFGAVPKQAQRFVGELTAQIRRRISIESPKRWNWTFGVEGDCSSWVPSAHYMLHAG